MAARCFHDGDIDDLEIIFNMKIDNHLKEDDTKRSKKHSKKKGHWLKRFFWFLSFNFLLICIVVLGGMVFIRQRLKTLPVVDIQYLSTYEPSKILDKDGEVIWKPTDKRMTSLTYEEIPEFYKTAIIAV